MVGICPGDERQCLALYYICLTFTIFHGDYGRLQKRSSAGTRIFVYGMMLMDYYTDKKK